MYAYTEKMVLPLESPVSSSLQHRQSGVVWLNKWFVCTQNFSSNSNQLKSEQKNLFAHRWIINWSHIRAAQYTNTTKKTERIKLRAVAVVTMSRQKYNLLHSNRMWSVIGENKVEFDLHTPGILSGGCFSELFARETWVNHLNWN